MFSEIVIELREISPSLAGYYHALLPKREDAMELIRALAARINPETTVAITILGKIQLSRQPQ